MTLELHTLRFGSSEWLTQCQPTLEAYASRHSLPLHVWDDRPRGYPCVKFCIIDMMRQFLAGKSTHFLYIDADVFIQQDAPLPDLSKPGFHAASDQWHVKSEPQWREWVNRITGTIPPPTFRYFNAGVFAMDRDTAARILAEAVPPYHEYFQDQHSLNLWVWKSGVAVNPLPHEFNRYGRCLEPSWFYHVWGEEKTADLRILKESGLLNEHPNSLIHTVEPLEWPNERKWVTLRFIKDAGLGNTMFEFAAGLAIARRLNLPFRWVWEPTDYRDFGLTHFGIAPNAFRPVEPILPHRWQGHRDAVESHVDAIRKSQSTECGVRSPFQTEECFKDIADEVAERFALPEVVLPHPVNTIPVGMQVRRGDYVTHKSLNVTNEQYFRNAMDVVRHRIPNAHFLVFSDDPDWCEEVFQSGDITVIRGGTPISDLTALASCQAHIISNSTFGWWGAWLGERRKSHTGIIVAPDRWFNEHGRYGNWNPVPARWLRASTQTVNPNAVSPILRTPEPFTLLEPPKHKRAIVYPWKAQEDTWQSLRYSLRSLHHHFADRDCPIYILGTRRPSWLATNSGRIEYRDAWRYADAVSQGVQLADEILWMNDDIVFLRDCGWEDFRTPRYLRPVNRDATVAPKNPWQAGVLRAYNDLVNDGYTDLMMYCTHLPYVYERSKALDIFRRYGVWEKIPLEFLYYNIHGEGACEIGGIQAKALPFGDEIVLNHTDNSLNREKKDELKRRFPEFGPWEIPVAFNC